MENLRIFNLQSAGQESLKEYLRQKSVSTGTPEIDAVLEGGIEAGNFYLWMGSAKGGKSTTLRCLGMKLAETFPVLYVNVEQLGRNVFAKIYQLKYNVAFRDEVHRDTEQVVANIHKMPNIPFYISFWTDELQEKSFNTTIRPKLEESLALMRKNDPEGRTPIIILENLSDMYNERIGGNDSLVNVVSQTAQDIKNFCIKHEVAIFLAHHSAKLQANQKTPQLDDVRDSKRVVDLAHSIFCSFYRETIDKQTGAPTSKTYHLAYLAGRGQSEYQEWQVHVSGLNMELRTPTPSMYPIK